MGCSYVVCPLVRELRPYHPQNIHLEIIVIKVNTGKVCAELSGIFDARDQDVMDYFIRFCEANKARPEDPEDLAFRIKSPTTFQSFVADLSNSVLADKLAF